MRGPKELNIAFSAVSGKIPRMPKAAPGNIETSRLQLHVAPPIPAMQTIHSIEKLAATVVGARGGVFFALFEHVRAGVNARWHAVWFGDAQSCMDTVIRRSALCTSGTIKGRDGWTTPEDYLSEWRGAMAHPRTVLRSDVDLRLDARQCALIRGRLGNMATEPDRLSLNLELHADVLAELVAAGVVSAREALDITMVGATPSGHGYRPGGREWPLPAFGVWRAKPRPGTSAYHWLADETGLSPMGWDTALVAELIARFATAGERAAPGSVESVMAQIRDRVKGACEFPSGQRVVVHTAAVEPGKPMGALARLIDCIGGGRATIVTNMHELIATDAVAHLAGLPKAAVAFPDLPGYG